MARRSFPLRPLVGLALLALGAACGSGDTPERRVLVIGWDGATWDLLDPLMERGRLPNLAALVARGRTADLESTRIPISSAAWPTIATGVGPGMHGVYGFLRPEFDGADGGDGSGWDARLISARDVDAPPLWRILSHRGRGVHVVGVPVTYPPEPIDGTFVAGMLSPFDADYAWPPGTADGLRAKGFVPDVGLWRQGELFDPSEVARQLDLKRDLLIDLLGDDHWSLAFFVFKSLDVLCHRPNLRLGGPEIAAHLERLDAVLGELVAAAGEDATIVLLSDHGFARYPQVFNVHRWLQDAGFSVARADAATGDSGGATLAAARATARAARLGALDLGASRAIAEVAEGPFGAIRVPRAGREPGARATEAQADATLDEVESALRALETPGGEPLVLEVWRGANLMPGPYAGTIVPDLVFRTRESYRCVTDTLLPALSPSPTAFPDHALDGVLVLAGPDVARAQERARATLVDIAPTVLYALDEAVPSTMQGAVPTPWFVGARPVRGIAASADPSLVPTSEVFSEVPASPADSGVVSRISDLGYTK